MCEANAYILKNGQEELILESVELIKPEDEGGYRLVSILGEQKVVQGKIKLMNLVEHKILFEAIVD